MQLAVAVLGPLAVRGRDAVLGPGDFGGAKPKQLFEILVLARGRSVNKDVLADRLWGERLPRDAVATLATYVSVVRRHLPTTVLVESQAGGYRFSAELADLDLDRFDQLAAQAARSGPATARAIYERALSLVRGELLEDEPYADWADADRYRYREATLAALLGAAEGALALREGDAALAHAERALHVDRLSEGAYRVKMLATFLLGRHEDALRTYRRCDETLRSELRTVPSAEMQRLQEAIRAQAPVGEVLPAPAWDRLPAAIDLRSTRSGLLGRVAELQLLHDTVEHALGGSFQLALVEGGAGMGKTRLLDELAGELEGIAVGRGRCSRLERSLPLVPLAAALRGALPASAAEPLSLVLPELAPHVGEAGLVRALEALAALVRDHCPIVLVLEDLQWTDEATLTALSYLSSRCGDLPFAVIGSLRPEEVRNDHPLRALKAKTRLSLAGLTRAELESAGLEDLYEATMGHPLMVAEYVRARSAGALDDLPLQLGPWVLERAEATGPYGYRILVTCALKGAVVQPEDLGPVLDLTPSVLVEHLDLLARAGLLVEVERGYDVACPLLRDVLLGAVSPARRRVLAQALRSRSGREAREMLPFEIVRSRASRS